MKSVSQIKFGRYLTPKETPALFDIRTEAEDLYDEGKFFEAYAVLFNYYQELGGQAVTLDIDDDTDSLNFKILQGSKTVKGSITEAEVSAETEIAKFSESGVALMRFLLAQNSELVYSKFSINGNSIFLGQKCPVKDLSPAAFSEMLSEIAIFSDAIDEMLEAEFPFIIPVDYENTIPLSKEETEAKIEFLRFWLEQAFELLSKTEDEGLKTYIILSTVFKILYLISPEGLLLNRFRNVLGIYREADDESADYAELNYKMTEGLKKIYETSDAEIEKSMFKTVTFFPEGEYTDFADMAQSIGGMLQIPVKCSDERKDYLILVTCEYIACYHLCKHGMPKAAEELLIIFLKVSNPDFFQAVGYGEVLFDEEKQVFFKGRICAEIEEINKKYSLEYPAFCFEAANLDFNSQENFAYSFLVEFIKLQITD